MEHSTRVDERLSAGRAGSKPASLSEMERTTRREVQELGRQMLAERIQAQAEAYPAPTGECACGEEAEYRGRREAVLHTVFGPITYRRAYYVCPHCHQGFCPLDVRLGLRPNAMSAEVERLAGMVGVMVPFAQGSQLLAELALLEVSDQTVGKASRAMGEAVAEQEQAWAQESQDTEALLRRKRTERPPLRLYGALDGGRVHTRGAQEHPWREVKIGAWFEARGHPPDRPDGAWAIRAEKMSYFADITSAAQFGHLLWATGVQRNAHLARELVILADGAKWIWDLVEVHFPHAVQIVDWYHACQYIAPIAQAAFPDPAEAELWSQQVRAWLWDGQLDQVIAACQAHVHPDRQDDPAQKAVTYFTNNRHRMNYPAYRAQGYQIGSGTIESGCKQITTQRMKVPGAIWNPDNARLVAKARAAFISGRWDEIAARRTHLPRAA